MSLMLEAVGASDPRYVWWYNVVGNAYGNTYVDLEQICAMPEFTYPEETQENITALGFKEFFRVWMFHYLQTLYRVP